MKHTLLSVIASLVLFCAGNSFAQTQDTLPYKVYEVGPLVSGGLSILWPGTIPDGSKTDISPAYTVGVLGTYAANRDIGFALALGYEARGMFFKEQNKSDPNETINFGYLTIQPSLRFKSFLLGVNINLPMSSSFSYTTSSYPTNPNSFSKDSLNALIDIRAEGLLPLVENDFGNLYFIIQASYSVTNAVGGKGFYTVSQNFANSPNPVTGSPLPSVQVGLSYLFSPGAKTK
jgi:hypothetical protein